MNGLLLFLNISGGEILVILVVVYLVFGPKKIPELARMLGKGINEMRRATNEIKNEITREISTVKKDMNIDLDIDRGDPLGIKKKMEEAMADPDPVAGSKSNSHQTAAKSDPEAPRPDKEKTTTGKTAVKKPVAAKKKSTGKKPSKSSKKTS